MREVSVMISALVFILLLGALIAFHELGHLIVAKICGMKIDAYSIGFGPKIFGFKIGETEYSLSWLLLGGYVRPAGPNFKEDVDLNDPDKDRYFVCQPVWKRALMVVGGPLFNFLLAFILLTGIFYRLGVAPVMTTVVGDIIKNSPAAKAGIKKGDKIIAINGEKVSKWQDIPLLIQESNGQKIRLTVKRGDDVLYMNVFPESDGSRFFVGIAPMVKRQKIDGLAPAIIEGTKQLKSQTELQTKGVAHLFKGKLSTKNVGGPVAIFNITSEAAKAGFGAILELAIILNIALAIFNLLPIPALDGGYLPLLACEAIRGRPLKKKTQIRIQIAGLVILFSILIFATCNDLTRLLHK